MQTAVTFQESSVREFLQACNAGYLDDVTKYLHSSIHFQRYRGGFPDVIFEGIGNLQFYLEGRVVIENYQCSVQQIESRENEVRVLYVGTISSDSGDTRAFTGTMIFVFWRDKILQILDTV